MDDNDTHEPNPWRSIGLQAALIVNRLRCQAQLTKFNKETEKDSSGNADGEQRRKEDPKADRTYVDTRLRELAAFERRAGGRKD